MTLEYSAIFVAIADCEGGLVTFYSRLLGLSPNPYIPQVYAEFQLPGLRLGIFQPNPSHQGEFTAANSGAMSLCVEVGCLEHAIAHLIALGYPLPGEIVIASHGREIYAFDPAGNRIILHESK